MDNKEHPFVKEVNILPIPVFNDETFDKKPVTDTGKEETLLKKSLDQGEISDEYDTKEVSLDQVEISFNRDPIEVTQGELWGIEDKVEVSLNQGDISDVKDAVEVSLDQGKIKGDKGAVSLDHNEISGGKDVILDQCEIIGDKDGVEVLDQGEIRGITDGVEVSLDQGEIRSVNDVVSLHQDEIGGFKDAVEVSLDKDETGGIKNAEEVSSDQDEIRGVKDIVAVSLDHDKIRVNRDAVVLLDQGEIKGNRDAVEVSLDQGEISGDRDAVEVLLDQGVIRGDKEAVEGLDQGGIRGDKEAVEGLDQGGIRGITDTVEVLLDQGEIMGVKDVIEVSLDQDEMRGVKDAIEVAFDQDEIGSFKDKVDVSLDQGKIRGDKNAVEGSLNQGQISGSTDAIYTLVLKDETLKQDNSKFSDSSEVNDVEVLYRAELSNDSVAIDTSRDSSMGEPSQYIFTKENSDLENKNITIMNVEVGSDSKPVKIKVIQNDVGEEVSKVKYLEEQSLPEATSKGQIEDQVTVKHREKGESEDAQGQKAEERQQKEEVMENNQVFGCHGKEELVVEEFTDKSVAPEMLESAPREQDMNKKMEGTEFQLQKELKPVEIISEVCVKEGNVIEEHTSLDDVMQSKIDEDHVKAVLGANGEEVVLDCNITNDNEGIEVIDTEPLSEKDNNATGDDAEGKPSTEEDKEEEWMDILGSGQLRKKVLRHGENDYRPSRSFICEINLEGRLADGTLIERHEGYKIPIGEGEVIQGIDFAVPLMNVGELALLEVGPRFGYGSQGLLPHVPPDANILYTVELLSAEEEPEIGQMAVIERKAVGHRKRERGNWWYMRQDHTMAIQCYRRALDFLDDAEESIPKTEKQEDAKDSEVHLHELLDDRLKVYNNLAAAQMKIKAYDTALQSIENVLRCQPQNVKALYRKGKILAAKGDYASAVEALRLASRFEPDSKLIRQELLKLLILHKEGAQSEKNLYKKMFSQKRAPEIRNSTPNKVPWVVVLGTVGALLAGVMAYRYRYI